MAAAAKSGRNRDAVNEEIARVERRFGLSESRESPTFMIGLEEVLRGIDERKAALDALRPLPAATDASLRAAVALDWTYHSNAIEGNTLTLRETQVVLEGIAIGGRSLREHLEAINHRDAIVLVEVLAAKSATIGDWNIRGIHQMVLRTINPVEAGQYRRDNVAIAGASFQPPSHELVHDQMEELVRWYQTDAQALHPVTRAAQLHARFVEVHPFLDGNGRTARIFMNMELVAAQEQRIIIATIYRNDCIGALKGMSHNKRAETLVRVLDFAQKDTGSIDWSEMQGAHTQLDVYTCLLRSR